MNKTHTVLFTLMIPALATLAACDRGVGSDYAPLPASDTAPATDAMTTEQTMAADPAMAPAGDDMGMADDEMGMADDEMGMASGDMAFAELDTNQDGGVSMDELTPDQMLHEHFAVADADGNGVLSEEEVTQHLADMGMETPEADY